MSSRVKVFRAGSLTPAGDAGAAQAVTRAADLVRPEGRTPRAGALFAAPTLSAVGRWVRGTALAGGNPKVHEMTVDPTRVWAYEVRAWERTDETRPESLNAYWATGIRLDALLQTPGVDVEEWEVVIAPTEVISARGVSTARVAGALPEWMQTEVKSLLSKAARQARLASAHPGQTVTRIDYEQLCTQTLASGGPCSRATFYLVDGDPRCVQHR